MDMINPTIDASSERLVSPVNSHNEWDPLEEIIVGRLEGATIPSDHPVVPGDDLIIGESDGVLEKPAAMGRAALSSVGYHYLRSR